MDVVLVPFDRQDRGIVALQGLGESRDLGRVRLLRLQAAARLELGRIARKAGHAMAAAERLVEDTAADIAGRAGQDDVIVWFPS